ncbi:MAG TPA: hypothetical protein VNA65_07860 [Candidatus Dormibacteraeota bacterium]|nr:hypothetical protein [Candidatus Dormibacteraeota bacterium]
MQDRSENEIVSRLLELENEGEADRRVELTGERYLSLIHDPNTGRAYVFRHGVDDTEGAELPSDTEFFEYPNANEAERAFDQQLAESRAAGEVIEEDSTDDIGDFESEGAEMRDVFADTDDDLERDSVISEEEEP